MGPVVCEPFLTGIVDPLFYSRSNDSIVIYHVIYGDDSNLPPVGFEDSVRIPLLVDFMIK